MSLDFSAAQHGYKRVVQPCRTPYPLLGALSYCRYIKLGWETQHTVKAKAEL